MDARCFDAGSRPSRLLGFITGLTPRSIARQELGAKRVTASPSAGETPPKNPPSPRANPQTRHTAPHLVACGAPSPDQGNAFWRLPSHAPRNAPIAVSAVPRANPCDRCPGRAHNIQKLSRATRPARPRARPQDAQTALQILPSYGRPEFRRVPIRCISASLTPSAPARCANRACANRAPNLGGYDDTNAYFYAYSFNGTTPVHSLCNHLQWHDLHDRSKFQ
jgi:hypothetical protein